MPRVLADIAPLGLINDKQRSNDRSLPFSGIWRPWSCVSCADLPRASKGTPPVSRHTSRFPHELIPSLGVLSPLVSESPSILRTRNVASNSREGSKPQACRVHFHLDTLDGGDESRSCRNAETKHCWYKTHKGGLTYRYDKFADGKKGRCINRGTGMSNNSVREFAREHLHYWDDTVGGKNYALSLLARAWGEAVAIQRANASVGEKIWLSESSKDGPGYLQCYLVPVLWSDQRAFVFWPRRLDVTCRCIEVVDENCEIC